MTDKPEALPPDKLAPVQGYAPGIPWSMHLRAYAVYAKRYGEQPAMIDLEGRGCRGGFATDELDVFIPGWREELSELHQLRKKLAEAEATIADYKENYRKVELLWKEACCDRDAHKMSEDAGNVLWDRALKERDAARAAITAYLAWLDESGSKAPRGLPHPGRERRRMESRRPYTPETLAEHWSCSAAQVRNLCKTNRLRHFTVGRGMFRITPEAADEFEGENRCALGEGQTAIGMPSSTVSEQPSIPKTRPRPFGSSRTTNAAGLRKEVTLRRLPQ